MSPIGDLADNTLVTDQFSLGHIHLQFSCLVFSIKNNDVKSPSQCSL